LARVVTDGLLALEYGAFAAVFTQHSLIVMASEAVFDNVNTLTAGTFFYLCLGKHGLEGVLLVWSLQNYPFGLACLFHGPDRHPHLSTTTNTRSRRRATPTTKFA
jgi:hypothetical protein